MADAGGAKRSRPHDGADVSRHGLEFRILGPLEVVGDSGPLPLGGRRQRALLALLLLHPGEVVSTDRLVDGLWGERPPATARTSLRNLVAQLRKLLGAKALVTRPPGYVLAIDPEYVDLTRFERLVAHGQRSETAERAVVLRDALALWRGPPLADLEFEHFAQGEIRRLDELRTEALEECIDAELALGQGAELVPELESLVEAYPLRERLRGQLVLALYRAGRQAEALGAYHEARHTLGEELGLDPSPALQELYGQILRQEPGLAPPRAPSTNLPPEPTSFHGRTRELDAVTALLHRADVRLVTLTGAGGSGKTRLALRAATEVAPDYRDGVWWVSLAPLNEPALVLGRVAQTLGVDEQHSLAEHVADKQLLLLLDNCEHVLEAAPAIADLLSACRQLKILATSREPLHLAAEREYLVPTLAKAEAVELFRQRAHTEGPEDTVLAICRRLDCLPLAIELAAARTKLLSPETLLERLERRLPLLSGGPRDAPERQQTLEATIAWSYELLSEEERRLFSRLSVFAGGSTLDAAERVCDAEVDTLQSLVDKNLLIRERDRYQMLETIREFAGERLRERDEAPALRRRHALYYFGLAESAPRSSGSTESLAKTMRSGNWRKLFGSETSPFGAIPGEEANLRLAITWGLQRDPTRFRSLWRRSPPGQ